MKKTTQKRIEPLVFKTWHRLRRVVLVLVVSFFVVGPYFPFLGSTIVNATTSYLLEPRSIQMSDSGASGNATITTGVGSGTNATYKVSIANINSFQSLVINFCDNSPIVGDTCLNTTGYPGETSPGNMSVSGATVAAISTTCGSGNEVGGTGWSVTEPNAYTVELTSDGSHSICSGSVGTPQTQVFSISGITNPDVIESFYGRLYTYAATSPTGYTSPIGSGVGTYLDYGGIALSTTQVITITAKVEEILEFCVSGDAQNVTVNPAAGNPWSPGDCSSTQASISPAVSLGTTVGSNVILTPEHVWTGEDYFQLSTNATNGAVLYMHSSNTCGGLSANGGTDSCPIQAAGDYSGNSGQTSAYNFTTAANNDIALFGMQLGTSSDGSVGSANGIGSLTNLAPYNGSSSNYGLDDAATTGVTGAYGNEIASTNSSCYLVNDSVLFAATSSLATPAGIYSTNISLIATGNF